MSSIKIIPYNSTLKEHIKNLNYDWLEKYFKVEASDVKSLSNPQEEIIDKGGFIFFAKMDGEIVGTISLLKKAEGVFELGKMAVTDKVQGKGIGTKLLQYCIDFAKLKGIQQLTLYSNTQLQSAIHLYQKYGFTEVELEPGLYDRANIKMQLDLQ